MSLIEKWGNACWFLFHTLAVKLKPERTDLVPKILSLVINVCKNLPCPDCSQHATATLNSLRYNQIKTRDQLMLVLWQFHNMVNKRRKVEFFSLDEYNKKYSNALFDPIVSNFIRVMKGKFPTNERGMLHSMQRSIMVDDVASFVSNNRQGFN